MALEQGDRPPELVLAERLRDPRVVVGRDDLEPGRGWRGVAADVRVALDPSASASSEVTSPPSRGARGVRACPASGLPSSAITRSPR